MISSIPGKIGVYSILEEIYGSIIAKMQQKKAEIIVEITRICVPFLEQIMYNTLEQDSASQRREIQMLHRYLPGDIRDRIQTMIEENKITQNELAEKLGMDSGTLSKYMTGKTIKFSAENIIEMAKIFDTSTDFLLGLTDVPYKTNYDIENMGLSVDAAKKLLRHEFDMDILNSLLVSPDFVLLVRQLKQLHDGTQAAAFAGMNQMIDSCSSLLREYAENNPSKWRAAQQATLDIQSIRQPEYKADLSAIEATFQRMTDHLREGASEYVGETRKLTSRIMERLISSLKKKVKDPMKLRGFTPEMFVKSIMEETERLEMTDEARAKFEEGLMALFGSLEMYAN